MSLPGAVSMLTLDGVRLEAGTYDMYVIVSCIAGAAGRSAG